MDDFFKMDVFFFVTTAAVILAGILCMVALVYFIKILRSIDHIAENVSEESDDVRGDLSVLRGKIRADGMKMKHFIEFFSRFGSRKKPHAKK